jgi:hypothetical protein
VSEIGLLGFLISSNFILTNIRLALTFKKKHRHDLENDVKYYRKWRLFFYGFLCLMTLASIFQLLMAISIIEKNRVFDPNLGKKAAVEGMGVESNTGQKEFEENWMQPFLRVECVGMGLFFLFQGYLIFLNDKMGKALELKVEEMVGNSESYLEIVRDQLVQVGMPYE